MRAFLGCVTTVADTHPYCLGSHVKSFLPQVCNGLLEGCAVSFPVSFLGHKYELPNGILDFLDYERMASRIMGLSLDLVIEKVAECKLKEPHSLVIELEQPRKYYQELMIATAKEYVKELIAKGIFDVSAIELLERTNGFEKLDSLASEVLARHLEEAKRILSNQLDDVQRAYNLAESSITGSGVSVYTSSALALMASGVFETGVLRSQANKADKEFSEACSAIEAQASSAEAKNDAHAIFGEFLPALSELMLDLCNQLFSVFLTELTSRGLFDFDSLKSYSLEKAEKMLGNIELIPDPKELLNQAFTTCPYCKEIYEQVFSLGMMDEETLDTAALFGLSDELIGELDEYCRQNVSKPETFNRYVDMLLNYRGTDRADTIATIFKDNIAKARNNYPKLQGFFSENVNVRDASVVRMIEANSELNQASRLLLMDEAEVSQAIAPEINSILEMPIGECLVREGLADRLRMPNYKDGQTFEQFYKALVSSIAQSIVDYGNRLQLHLSSCLDEAEIISSEIASRKELIWDRRLKASDAINRLHSLKGKLRFRDVELRWGKIDKRIDSIRCELEDLIFRCDIETLKKLRADVMHEGDSVLSCYLDSSEVKAMNGVYFAVMDSSGLDKLLDTEEIEHAVECKLNPKTQIQDTRHPKDIACVNDGGDDSPHDGATNSTDQSHHLKTGNPQAQKPVKKFRWITPITALVAGILVASISFFVVRGCGRPSVIGSNLEIHTPTIEELEESSNAIEGGQITFTENYNYENSYHLLFDEKPIGSVYFDVGSTERVGVYIEKDSRIDNVEAAFAQVACGAIIANNQNLNLDDAKSLLSDAIDDGVVYNGNVQYKFTESNDRYIIRIGFDEETEQTEEHLENMKESNDSTDEGKTKTPYRRVLDSNGGKTKLTIQEIKELAEESEQTYYRVEGIITDDSVRPMTAKLYSPDNSEPNDFIEVEYNVAGYAPSFYEAEQVTLYLQPRGMYEGKVQAEGWIDKPEGKPTVIDMSYREFIDLSKDADASTVLVDGFVYQWFTEKNKMPMYVLYGDKKSAIAEDSSNRVCFRLDVSDGTPSDGDKIQVQIADPLLISEDDSYELDVISIE